MVVSNNDVRNTVKSYVDANPADGRCLGPLLDLLADAIDVTDRDELRGHVTASAVVINAFGLVLLVRHLASGLWTQPGGHLQHEDDTVAVAAMRELAEKTGIQRNQVELVTPEPIQIFRHTTPTRTSAGGPAHLHFDFRFVFCTTAEVTRLRVSEVDAAVWATPEQLPNAVLRDRVLALPS